MITSVYVPTLVLPVVVTLRVDVADGLGFTGVERVHVAFAGQPVRERSTLPLNPLRASTVIVLLPDPPCENVNEVGLAEIAKSGGLHESNLNEPNAVAQLKLPVEMRYSFVYQNVQSSLGSMRIAV